MTVAELIAELQKAVDSGVPLDAPALIDDTEYGWIDVNWIRVDPGDGRDIDRVVIG